MLERDDIDIVFIATPWELHARCASTRCRPASMPSPRCRPPSRSTNAGIWWIRPRRRSKHCMMLENCCYGREELFCLNLCRLGLLGELLHGEAAYIHDLRGQMNDVEHGTGSGGPALCQAQRQSLSHARPRAGGAIHGHQSGRPVRLSVLRRLACGGPHGVCQVAFSARSPVEPDHGVELRRHQHDDHQDRARPLHHGAVGRDLAAALFAAQPDPGHRGTFAGYPSRLVSRASRPTRTSGSKATSSKRTSRSTSIRCGRRWANWPRRRADMAAWTG